MTEHDDHAELDRLRAENTELRRRLEQAEALIDEVRRGAIERRAEIRALAEELPAAVSRRALLGSMLREARRHPDKRGVAGRAARKLGRTLGDAARAVRRGRG